MPIKKTNTDNLKAFRNLGFVQSSRSSNDTQAVGNCVFCGKPGHFYINRDTKQWDCKKCGAAGGFVGFLDQLIDRYKLKADDPELLALAEHRSISPETLVAYDLGYNPYTEEYMLPIYIREGEEARVYNIRRFNPDTGSMRSTAGCSNGILNWDIMAEYKTIWLCEGEWDAMAMAEVLFNEQRENDELALGMPGAATFKAEWLSMFLEKDVRVLYDSDAAGRAGALKCYKLLKRSASSVQFVHWGDVKDGYDVRDFYIDNGAHTYDRLSKLLKDEPEGVDHSSIEVKKDSPSYNGPGLTAEEVYKKYSDWLYMPNTDVLDVMFGTLIANRQETDNVWLFLVAPPGATKTSLLESLVDSVDIVYKSSLGAKALVSGSMSSNGADPSLLPKLNKKNLIIEDFTTVLSIPHAYREEIFGILRSAYNGRYERDYGNGRVFRCECNFGLLAGVTPAIEHYGEDFAALGERFLNYYLPVPSGIEGRKPFLRKALENSHRKEQCKRELSDCAKKVLNAKFDVTPKLSVSLEDKILDLAQFTSMMRGTVRRERYSAQKEVTHQPYAELGTRLIKQFCSLLDGVARFRRSPEITENEFKIIRQIAYSSTPTDRRKFLKAMWSDPEKEWNTGEIAEITKLPRYPLCDRIAENLSLLGAITKSQTIEGVRGTYSWRIAEDFAQLIKNTGVLN